MKTNLDRILLATLVATLMGIVLTPVHAEVGQRVQAIGNSSVLRPTYDLARGLAELDLIGDKTVKEREAAAAGFTIEWDADITAQFTEQQNPYGIWCTLRQWGTYKKKKPAHQEDD